MRDKIFSFLIGSMLCTASLHAEYKYTDNFYKQGGGHSKKLDKLLKSDAHYIKANGYLENPTSMKIKTINAVDPENKKAKSNYKEIKVPRYDKALKEFVQSVKQYNNPVSAYTGLMIINLTLPSNTMLKERKLFSKTLYEKEKNICEGYLQYGRVFEEGILTKVDKEKAISIYEEGMKKACKDGWQQSVLSGKIWTLKRGRK